MEFRTEIKLGSQQENQIDYKSKILLLGSCFSEHIGNQLSYFKFDVLTNPFGTIFNPVALERLIQQSIHQTIDESAIVENQGINHSLHHHSQLSALDKNTLIENISKAQQQTLAYLNSSSHIIITLGTAWVYEYVQTQSIVASCHKIPGTQFKKRLLTIPEIQDRVTAIVKTINNLNPTTQIIFTVSPVRHTKDGIVENNLSKAHLISALHQIQHLIYFPSYEIMMDDLRDYRFYEADMIHPNQTAIQYIWKKFSNTWMDENTTAYFKSIQSIQQSLLHKPFNENSDAHQQFLIKLKDKITRLEQELNIRF